MILSIITVTYNNFDELKKTLDSIPKLDFIESIVVNGGDCSNTKEFLKSYSGKSISEKDNGISDAFNKGINLASGDLLMFLNSGDILLESSYLKNAREMFFQDSQTDFVHSNIILLDQSGAQLFMKPTFSSLGRGMPYLHPTMIVRRNVFEQIGLFNVKYKIAMDFDFIVRLTKAQLHGDYYNSDFPVLMDGGGKSIINEGKSIRECFNILKINHELTPENLLGYFIRYVLFLVRKLSILLGQEEILLKLKKRKHSK